LRQALETHHPFSSIKSLYDELLKLLKPQNDVKNHSRTHFRLAMELLENHDEFKNAQTIDKIRFHMEQSIFYDPTFVQAYYNLALLDYRQNALEQTRNHLQKILTLNPNHFKANLMLCDLLLELDQNLYDSVHCYMKLLNKAHLESINETNINSSGTSIASKELLYKSYNSKEFSNFNESRKVLSLAHHNLCSVLEMLKKIDESDSSSKQLMNNMNATMNISTYCSNLAVKLPSSDNIIQQQIHFQVPITST
jgi:tetratricopeptide (TPR) repeat protein